MSRSATAMNAISTSGRSVAAWPRAHRVPTKKISTITTPANTSESGLVSVALRAQHPAPIPIGEPAKALRLESLGDVGAHELDGAHELAHEARELAPVFHLLARAPPHLPDQRPDDEHQERRAHQRDERQPPRQ